MNRTKGTPPTVLSKKERIRIFGIDCPSDLIWKQWKTGGEYSKKILIKNVSSSTQTITYRLPSSKNFYMEFPTPIKLSQGMSHALEVKFRPVAMETYTDYVEVITKGNSKDMSFFIRVRAVLPNAELDHPDFLDFGFCPANETSRFTFQLTSVGELPISFKWAVNPPFQLEPASGSLVPGESCTMTAIFTPQDASVFVASSVCTLSNGNSFTMKMSGIGKYPFLAISDNDLDFGQVMIGNTTEREITLRNQSLVNATFSLKKVNDDVNNVFTFKPESGVIQPEGSMTIKVTYTPITTGAFSLDYFELCTPGGNPPSRIKCTGTAIGPHVTISVNSINFGNVQIGETVSKVIKVQNHSDTIAEYHFLTEQFGVFQFSKVQGSLGPKKSDNITITFAPTEPLNFYKRIYLLIKNQHSLFLDVLGTGFTDKRRPAPFSQRQVDAYRRRCALGLAKCPPEELANLLQKHENGVDLNATASSIQIPRSNGMSHDEQKKIDALLTSMHEIQSEPLTSLEIMREYFQEDTDTTKSPASLDRTNINFGSCSRFKMAEYKIVNVRNHTTSKMCCNWFSPRDPTTGEEPAFVVYPNAADIQPQSSVEFKVQFRPTADNAFYSAELECMVYFKIMRSFRLVDENTFTPPKCLTLRATGHTFRPMSESFLPRAVLTPNKTLVFPSCHTQEQTYQTIILRNKGDCPMTFEFELDSYPVFQCKPKQGIIPANSFQLITFMFSPTASTSYAAKAKCVLNESVNNILTLNLVGEGFLPQIKFENEGKLYFKPTHIGSVATRKLQITNPSKIPTMFEWDLNHSMENILVIDPPAGVLRGSESMELTCVFAPRKQQRYNFKVPCRVSSLNNNQLQQRLLLTVIGEGTAGAVTMEPSVLDFGTTLIGSFARKSLTLFNSSDCDIKYQLVLKNHKNGDVPPGKLYFEEKPYGVLPARSHKTINAQYQPDDRVQSSFTLYCKLPLDIPTNKNANPQLLKSISRSTTSLINQQTQDSPAQRTPKLRGGLVLPPPNYPSPGGNTMVNSDTTGTAEFTMFSGNDYIIAEDGQKLYMSPTVDNDDEAMDLYPKCEGVGSGSYPLVAITDLRCEGVPKSVLWDQFDVNRLNEVLGEVITEQEKTRNKSDDLSFKNTIKGVQRFLIDLGARLGGNQPTVVYAKLENIGKLPVQFSFLFSKDHANLIDVERWAADAENSNHEDHTEMDILDNELFQISPKKGAIEPGRYEMIKIMYRHDKRFVGVHSVPLLFKLRDGKQLVFDLTGRTLDHREKYLHFTTTEHTFHTVEIGDLNPPVQYYQLRNLCNETVVYSVDMTPFEEHKRQNWNFEIFKCLNPSGIITKNKSEFLKFIFQPLEAKEYSIDVPLRIEGGETHVITFRGYGCRPSRQQQHGEPNTARVAQLQQTPMIRFMDIPITQTMLAPSQLAKLSMEILNLGNVSTLSIHRRMVVVINTSSSESIRFEWSVSSFLRSSGDQEIEIEPKEGVVGPGEVEVCKIVFKSGTISQILDRDIECRLTNLSEKSRKEMQIKREEEIARTRPESMNSDSPSPAPHQPSWLQSRRGDNTVSIDSARSAGSGLGMTPNNNGNSKRLAPRTSVTVIPYNYSIRKGMRPMIDTMYSNANTRGNQGEMTMSSAASSRVPGAQSNLSPNYNSTHYNPMRPRVNSGLGQFASNTTAANTTMNTGSGGNNVVTNRDQGSKGNEEFSSVLYLRIQVRVMPLEHFKSSYEDRWDTCYIPKLYEHQHQLNAGSHRALQQEVPTTLPVQSTTPKVVPKLAFEKSFFEEVLAEMLQDVVHDKDVATAYENINDARVPFYFEFAQAPASSRPASARSVRSESISRPQSARPSRPVASDDDNNSSGNNSEESPTSSSSARVPASLRQQPNQQQAEATSTNNDNATMMDSLFERRKKQVLQTPDFHGLIEWILDETAFNLLTEAVHGGGSLLA